MEAQYGTVLTNREAVFSERWRRMYMCLKLFLMNVCVPEALFNGNAPLYIYKNYGISLLVYEEKQDYRVWNRSRL
jgi:hypothetical protein